jgi:hypothetical protein
MTACRVCPTFQGHSGDEHALDYHPHAQRQHGESIIVRCKEGYRSALVNLEDTIMHDSKCLSTTRIAIASSGDTSVASCNSEDKYRSTCTDVGWQSANRCVPIKCTFSPAVIMSHVFHPDRIESMEHGTDLMTKESPDRFVPFLNVVNLTCREGYRPGSQDSRSPRWQLLSCQVNCIMASPMPCLPVLCGSKEMPKNSVAIYPRMVAGVSVSAGSYEESFNMSHLDTISFVCNKGYAIENWNETLENSLYPYTGVTNQTLEWTPCRTVFTVLCYDGRLLGDQTCLPLSQECLTCPSSDAYQEILSAEIDRIPPATQYYTLGLDLKVANTSETRIVSFHAGLQAERSGLQINDVIVSVNAVALASLRAIIEAFQMPVRGASVLVGVVRSGSSNVLIYRVSADVPIPMTSIIPPATIVHSRILETPVRSHYAMSIRLPVIAANFSGDQQEVLKAAIGVLANVTSQDIELVHIRVHRSYAKIPATTYDIDVNILGTDLDEDSDELVANRLTETSLEMKLFTAGLLVTKLEDAGLELEIIKPASIVMRVQSGYQKPYLAGDTVEVICAAGHHAQSKNESESKCSGAMNYTMVCSQGKFTSSGLHGQRCTPHRCVPFATWSMDPFILAASPPDSLLGQIVNVTCKPGFRPRMANQSRPLRAQDPKWFVAMCLANCSYNVSHDVCAPILCPVPLHAGIMENNTNLPLPHGSIRTLECHPGYTLSPSRLANESSDCQAANSSSNLTRRACGMSFNMTPIASSRNSNVSFGHCATRQEVFCYDGELNISQKPCQPHLPCGCGSAACTVSNWHASAKNFWHWHASAKNLFGSNIAGWSPTRLLDTGMPFEQALASIFDNDPEKFFHSTEFSIACTEGYRAVGENSTHATCSESRQFRSVCNDCVLVHNESCKPVQCPAFQIANIANVTSTSPGLFGQTILVTCDESSRAVEVNATPDLLHICRLPQTFNATCNDACKWDTNGFECRLVNCKPCGLLQLPNVSIRDGEETFLPNSISYSRLMTGSLSMFPYQSPGAMRFVHAQSAQIYCLNGTRVTNTLACGVSPYSFDVVCQDGRFLQNSECGPIYCEAFNGNQSGLDDPLATASNLSLRVGFQASVTVKCKKGHRAVPKAYRGEVSCHFPHSYVASCTMCGWNQPMECRKVSCRTPNGSHVDRVDPANHSTVDFDTNVTVHCSEGHIAAGLSRNSSIHTWYPSDALKCKGQSYQTVCGENCTLEPRNADRRISDQPLVSCQPATCPPFASLSGLRAGVSLTKPVSHGSEVNVSCVTGFAFDSHLGPETVTAVCRSDCSYLRKYGGDLLKEDVSVQNSSANASLEFSWQRTFTCAAKPCLYQRDVNANVSVNGSGVMAGFNASLQPGDFVTVSCLEGHLVRQHNDQSSSCDTFKTTYDVWCWDGVLVNDTRRCVPVQCPQYPSQDPYLRLSKSSALYGESINITCANGSRFNVSSAPAFYTATCNASCVYDLEASKLPGCVLSHELSSYPTGVSCGLLYLENVGAGDFPSLYSTGLFEKYPYNLSKSEAIHNESIIVTCRKGFEVVGGGCNQSQFRVSCRNGRYQQDTIKRCVPSACPEFSPATHDQHALSWRYCTWSEHATCEAMLSAGGRVGLDVGINVTCTPGYRAVPQNHSGPVGCSLPRWYIMHCRACGWEMAHACQPISCAAPTGLHIKATSPASFAPYGESMHVSCADGYVVAAVGQALVYPSIADGICKNRSYSSRCGSNCEMNRTQTCQQSMCPPFNDFRLLARSMHTSQAIARDALVKVKCPDGFRFDSVDGNLTVEARCQGDCMYARQTADTNLGLALDFECHALSCGTVDTLGNIRNPSGHVILPPPGAEIVWRSDPRLYGKGKVYLNDTFVVACSKDYQLKGAPDCEFQFKVVCAADSILRLVNATKEINESRVREIHLQAEAVCMSVFTTVSL